MCFQAYRFSVVISRWPWLTRSVRAYDGALSSNVAGAYHAVLRGRLEHVRSCRHSEGCHFRRLAVRKLGDCDTDTGRALRGCLRGRVHRGFSSWFAGGQSDCLRCRVVHISAYLCGAQIIFLHNCALTRRVQWTAGFRFSPIPSAPAPPPLTRVVGQHRAPHAHEHFQQAVWKEGRRWRDARVQGAPGGQHGGVAPPD